MTEPKPVLAVLERFGKALEDAVLTVLLTGMIVLAAGQIVLRNLFDFGFIWTDELLRLLVLWLAVAGALAASRRDRHIAISLFDRMLPERAQHAVGVLTHLFTASICGLIAWYSLAFVQTSKEFGDLLLGGVPAWILQAVMPVGFGLMCYRFVVLALRDLVTAIRGHSTR